MRAAPRALCLPALFHRSQRFFGNALPILAFLDAHINHGLRIRLPIGAHRGQILLERAQGGQHLAKPR